MKPLTAFNIAVGIGAAIFFASLAPPAQAGENPYIPDPVASWESADHGHGSYCSKPFLLGTCEAPKLTGGGTGTGSPDLSPAEKAAIRDAPHPDPKTPCGPKA